MKTDSSIFFTIRLLNIQKIIKNKKKRKNKWREYKNILDNLGRFCYDLYIKEEKNQKKGKEEIPVGTVESQFKFNMNQNCIFHTVHL
ncbi:hypothetical protein BHF69_10760 [Anaerostipes sp. 992a]|nr:hypothetical protein BHF69_10760 [Anaerostipes sp. 992a]